MTATATATAPKTEHAEHSHATEHAAHEGHHRLRLWPFFLALLALTACEVGLYELWRGSAVETAEGVKSYIFPKYALTWMVLIFTLPKAAIVLIYFMHLKFEKLVITILALAPIITVFICVLPTLTDTAALKDRTLNRANKIGLYGEYAEEPEAEKQDEQPTSTGGGDDYSDDYGDSY